MRYSKLFNYLHIDRALNSVARLETKSAPKKLIGVTVNKNSTRY